MNGLELAAELRAQEKTNGQLISLPIFIVTAYNKQILLKQPEAIYINGMLTKPVMPSYLFNALLHREIPNLPTVEKVNTQRFDGIRVLLVEDNELNQEVAASIIRKRGAVLTIAWNGQEAVDLVQHQSFDLVLMDLHMPIMGGIEATLQIHKLAQGKNLPIIAMTAAVMTEDRRRCTEAGMVDFIPKPVEPEDICRVLRTYTQSELEIPVILLPAAPLESNLVFDSVQGLNRLDGDHALQQRLLFSFLEQNRNLSQHLDQLLSEKKINKAIDLIHAVKGVAANLSAVALSIASNRLLEELRDDIQPTSITVFDAILNETFKQIQHYIYDYREPDSIKTKIITSSISLNSALLTIKPYIISQEIIPDILIDTLRPFSDKSSPYFLLVNQLLNQIDNFEHQDALISLNTLLD